MLQGTVGSPSLPHKLLATFHFFRQTTLQFFAVLYSYQEYPVKCSLSYGKLWWNDPQQGREWHVKAN